MEIEDGCIEKEEKEEGEEEEEQQQQQQEQQVASTLLLRTPMNQTIDLQNHGKRF